ncbi:MAG: acyl-CoA dehydrogenase family protein [Candidatus Dormibacteraeota bacterium]|uniref:Acyl-CoA dehydrogenase family protein n=1 Tax=Candidatus Dormiibacter inghamiae TaxID=3127013 RepID=A0A934NC18_9BACT|nr:acyl-CoA dehydrogenase family protein [Candidatus Dormibacteraeota bacterium]MBJ7606814.1 acyl-CoA dehydrogenase family protein [Candidatus Dormibacteraeota bacterium]
MADARSSEERRLFRASVRAFVEREVLPRAEELDQHGRFPQQLFGRLAELGYLGLRYPEALGGQDADFATECVFYEELAAGSLSLAAIAAMQSLMGTVFVYRFGTPEQHNSYLRPALRGERIATFALTEPEAGSDLGGLRTRARRTADGWHLTGSKTWITNAPVASFLTVGAKTSDEPGLKNIALFLLDADTPGFAVGRPIEKLGTRSSLTSEVHIDCEVPPEALLGAEGDGVKNVGGVLSEIRIMTAFLALGLGRRALLDSATYAAERQAFGKPIGEYQLIAAKLADMATDLQAARTLSTEVARQVDEGGTGPLTTLAAMAKLHATEACVRIVDETTRIFGSYGFASEYAAQRYFRDARFLLSGGGTSEILRTLIGRDVLRQGGWDT